MIIASVSGLLVGCSEVNLDPINEVEDEQATDTASDVIDDSIADIENQSEYVGLSVEEAMDLADSQGDTFRVVQEDGEFMAVTMDFRPGRINATVEDGLVVSVDIEG